MLLKIADQCYSRESVLNAPWSDRMKFRQPLTRRTVSIEGAARSSEFGDLADPDYLTADLCAFREISSKLSNDRVAYQRPLLRTLPVAGPCGRRGARERRPGSSEGQSRAAGAAPSAFVAK
jgi:hypothetical protein